MSKKMSSEDIRSAFKQRKVNVLRKLIISSKLPLEKKPVPLFSFDSGTTISMEEGIHNVLILGGTGRGKTTGFVSSMLFNLVREGMGGLVVDVKNTYSQTVRRIAAASDRHDDVVEIGTHPTAEPANLLGGLDWETLRECLQTIILIHVDGSRNYDWHLKGVRQVHDCARLLTMLDDSQPGTFTPSLAILSRMISNPVFARSLWAYFQNNVATNMPEHKEFIADVESDCFHVLHTPSERVSDRNDFDQQVTWRLTYARKILSEMESTSLSTNLSAPDGLNVDLEDLIFRQNKIVLVRFSALSGGPGKIIARMLKERFYQACYARYGDAEPCGNDSLVFCVMDEFQDILNLDESSSLDDFGWFSKAREFKVVNVIATQAMSSLYKPGMEYRINAMMANFGTKIILQTDDPATDVWAKNYFEAGKPVQGLGKGEAIVGKYALPERRLVVGVESMQKTHDRTKAMLDSLPLPYVPQKPVAEFDVNSLIAMISRPKWAWSPSWRDLYEKYPEAVDIASTLDVDLDKHEKYLDTIKPMIEIVFKEALKLKTKIESVRFSSIDKPLYIESTSYQTNFLRLSRQILNNFCQECGNISETTDTYALDNKTCLDCFLKKDNLQQHVRSFVRDFSKNLNKPIEKISYPEGWQNIVIESVSKILLISKKIMIDQIIEENGRLIITANSEEFTSLMSDNIDVEFEEATKKSDFVCTKCGHKLVTKLNGGLAMMYCCQCKNFERDITLRTHDPILCSTFPKQQNLSDSLFGFTD